MIKNVYPSGQGYGWNRRKVVVRRNIWLPYKFKESTPCNSANSCFEKAKSVDGANVPFKTYDWMGDFNFNSAGKQCMLYNYDNGFYSSNCGVEAYHICRVRQNPRKTIH